MKRSRTEAVCARVRACACKSEYKCLYNCVHVENNAIHILL